MLGIFSKPCASWHRIAMPTPWLACTTCNRPMAKAAAVSPCALQRQPNPAPSDQARHGAPRTSRTGFCRTAPARQGKKRARQQMGPAERRFAEKHLNLARSQARRFASRHGLVYEDVLGAAYEGLCKAAMVFDHSRGHRPSSYVVPKVKGECCTTCGTRALPGASATGSGRCGSGPAVPWRWVGGMIRSPNRWGCHWSCG